MSSTNKRRRLNEPSGKSWNISKGRATTALQTVSAGTSTIMAAQPDNIDTSDVKPTCPRPRSVSLSSSLSSSSSHPQSPPGYSQSLPDPPPAFMDTPNSNPPLVDVAGDQAPPPFPSTPNQTTTWWYYVSSTLTKSTDAGNATTTVNTTTTLPDIPPTINIQPDITMDPPPGPSESHNPSPSQDRSGWYSGYVPWTWKSPPAETVATLPEEESLRNDGGPSESEDQKQSEVTEQPISHESVENPVTTSFSSEANSWSAFMRILGVKRIENGEVNRDENGVEVMEIDFPDDEHPRKDTDNPRTSSTLTLPLPSPTPSARAPSHSPKRIPSPAPSKQSMPSKPKPPNRVLPKWEDTFFTPPRSVVLPPQRRRTEDEYMFDRGASGDDGIGGKFLGRTVKFVNGWLGNGGIPPRVPEVTITDEERFVRNMPKAWRVLGEDKDVLRGCKKVVVIGVHGWFPGAIVRTVMGEPTGTSTKFASMMGSALEEFSREHQVQFEKVTLIPLEGEGTIDARVNKLYGNLLSNSEWTKALYESDVVFFAAHSQGTIVSTHLLDKLLMNGHIQTTTTTTTMTTATTTATTRKTPQRVCVLALCGIHLGPLRYLRTSTLVGPYLQYFESLAARELFEFQNTESQVSKNYVKALENVLDHGTKIVYIASLNDQVVPIYSGLFTAASHPLILRALYIDGDAYSSSDFLSNLLTLLIRVLNAGLSDSDLLAHLSEATAGSLNGVGHSTVYEEITNYTLAVKYLFLANSGDTDSDSLQRSKLRIEPFNAGSEQNDYEIPWSLRDLIAHPQTFQLFSAEIEALREAFKAWQPKTATLRELRRKVAPLGKARGIGLSASGDGRDRRSVGGGSSGLSGEVLSKL